MGGNGTQEREFLGSAWSVGVGIRVSDMNDDTRDRPYLKKVNLPQRECVDTHHYYQGIGLIGSIGRV